MPGLFDKPSLEDALEHYGVKGMRWGVRKSSSERVSTEQIKAARLKNDARLAKIQQADIDYRLATTKKGKKAAIDTIAKYGREINNDPDTRIASKMTKGEKVLITALAGPFAVLPIAVNAKTTSKSSWDKKVPQWNAQQDANVKKVKAKVQSGKL